jgi:integrase
MAEGVYRYTLADGTVRFYAMYRTSNGVLRKRRGFASEREAVRWRTQMMAAVYRGEVVAVRGTFAERFDAWLEEHRPRIESGTYRDYRVHGDKRLKPFFGAMRPAAITPADVRRYVAHLVGAGDLSAKTINNSVGVLRVFFAHLEEDGDVVRNPARSSPGGRERIKLRAEHREMDYLRLDEIPRYLDACDDVYRPLAETLIATGLRISEALALTWADVDWSERSLRVLRSRKAQGYGSTKGDRFRSVDYGARLEAVLRSLHHAGAPLDARTLVFRGPRGGELSRSDVSRDLHKHALEDAGLRRTLRLHDLRHSAAASWLAAGLPLIYVQRQLGHASITTTQQVYGHLEESFLRDAADRVERLIWTPADGSDGTDGDGVFPRVFPRGPPCDTAMARERRKPRHLRGFSMRRRGLEPPRAIQPTRPSTLRVYQFRHRRRWSAARGRGERSIALV